MKQNQSHVSGIAAMQGILQASGGTAKKAGHDPKSIFCRWAYAIAESRDMPMISVTKALAAFDDWGVEPPYGLISQAKKLCMNKPTGEPY